jgi:hypothetical protein
MIDIDMFIYPALIPPNIFDDSSLRHSRHESELPCNTMTEVYRFVLIKELQKLLQIA